LSVSQKASRRKSIVVPVIVLISVVSSALAGFSFLGFFNQGGPEYLAVIASEGFDVVMSQIFVNGRNVGLSQDGRTMGGLMLIWTDHTIIDLGDLPAEEIRGDGWRIVWHGPSSDDDGMARRTFDRLLTQVEEGELRAPSLGQRWAYLQTMVVQDFLHQYTNWRHAVNELVSPPAKNDAPAAVNHKSFVVRRVLALPFDCIKAAVLLLWVNLWALFPLSVAGYLMYLWLALMIVAAIGTLQWLSVATAEHSAEKA